jgi:tetratricopeptide (TPR) repeat protein
MTSSTNQVSWLRGKRVAFTGRLASLTRAEAAALVHSHGGTFVTIVNRRTDVLVVGQEGLPLTTKGLLSNKLRAAQKLQAVGVPAILSEEELLTRLGLSQRADEIRRLYTQAQVCRLLGVRRDRLRSWLALGLIQPAQEVHGLCLFEFSQVTGVKTLVELTEAGAKAKEIRRSLEQLGRWLPQVKLPLSMLALLESDGKLLFRLEQGCLAEPSGQMHLDFSDQPAPEVIEAQPVARTAEEWWTLGWEKEEAGELEEAARAYRKALLAEGPNADLVFNLGNVLYALGQKEAAAERLRQAVELDRGFAEAWYNLGLVLLDLEDTAEALEAFAGALRADPQFADAHFDLANLLERSHRADEARTHWEAFLKLAPDSEQAVYAQACLKGWAQRINA